MSTYFRDDLHTDRSMQLDSIHESTLHSHASHSLYLDKMEAHLAFMEKEFRRNMEWQKSLLNQARADRKGQAVP
jgi:hypothetical protein